MKMKLILAVVAGLAAGAIAAVSIIPQAREAIVPFGGPRTTGKALIGGPFSLVDQNGTRVTEKDFRDRYMLVFFGFTSCPDICPAGLQLVAGALDKLGEKADRVVPVFISVDPERDTPARLGEYVRNFDSRFVGLTGTPEEIAAELRRDRNATAILHHEFGPADLDRAAVLANPSKEQTLGLTTHLRQRRAELTRTRAEMAADARVYHAVGRVEEAEQLTQRLQSIDNDLGQTEDSLDRVLQFLRPNSAHRTDQRTRTAALAIGNDRLQAVRQYLIDATDPDSADRIEVRRARLRTVVTSEDGQAPLGRIIATTRRRRF